MQKNLRAESLLGNGG